MKFLTPTVPEIWREAQNFKSRLHDPIMSPFDRIWHFSLVPLLMNLHAKLEFSSSYRSGDMERVPKFLK